MAWRREVKAVRGTEAERPARDGVQAVKVALGERGRPWWEQTALERKQRWEAAVPLPGSRQAPAGLKRHYKPMFFLIVPSSSFHDASNADTPWSSRACTTSS